MRRRCFAPRPIALRRCGVVERGDEARDRAAVEGRDEGAADREEDLARHRVGVVLSCRHGLQAAPLIRPALKRGAQALGTRDNERGMALEETEETVLLRQKCSEPLEHGAPRLPPIRELFPGAFACRVPISRSHKNVMLGACP